MRLVVSAVQMAEMDRQTIHEIGVPGVVLMENAGLGVVAEIKNILGRLAGKRILIFCGKGNNGGDGYVVARNLHNAGARPEVYLIGNKSAVKGDALINLEIVMRMGLDVKEIQVEKELDIPPGADLIVDAIFGTGIVGAVEGLAAKVIDFINQFGTPVVAIDLPSGLETDTGLVHGPCVRATATVTMAHLKRGLLLPPGRDYAGKVSVVDIGIPPEVSQRQEVKTYLVEDADIAPMLPRRPRDAHKNTCGKVFILAGSLGMTGAATLTSTSVLRAGAGLAILGIPESLNPILEEKVTEVITRPLPEGNPGCVGWTAQSVISELLEWADVVALGPGLRTHSETVELVHWIVQSVQDKPMVIDADGLNALSQKPELIKSSRTEMVLTPHAGELSRLIKKPTKEILDNRIEIVREVAAEWQKVLVLKGSPTIIGDKDGSVFLNPTGNAGMATGGSGDVLTGAIAGLLAQGASPRDAAITGVYLHGLAGDLARAKFGEMGLIAGDILEELPMAIKRFENPAEPHDA